MTVLAARLTLLFAILVSAPAPAVGAGPTEPEGTRPLRIVSLDYCADQYVLKFVDRARILALSPDSDASFSYMRAAATGIPQVRPVTEDILLLGPDLVVRSYGGEPGIGAFLQRAGIRVLDVGYADDLAAVRAAAVRLADELGSPEEGLAVAADMDRRLAAIKQRAEPLSALYMTPSGVTAGAGTLVNEMLAAAGLRNFLEEPGWHDLPLERLASETPDLVAAAFFENEGAHGSMWASARHPTARRTLKNAHLVTLEGAWVSCGAWFLVDAIEALGDGVPLSRRAEAE